MSAGGGASALPGLCLGTTLSFRFPCPLSQGQRLSIVCYGIIVRQRLTVCAWLVWNLLGTEILLPPLPKCWGYRIAPPPWPW